MKKYGSLIVVSGPSGVGKSTLVGKVRAGFENLDFSVSCTTRKPRPGEIDGQAYHFLSHDDFARMAAAGEFLEYATVFSESYGTLKSEVADKIRRGRNVLLDIDIQGAMNIRDAAAYDEELRSVLASVMILPPSFETLERRLRSRATESEEQLRLRIEGARHELSCWREYDYVIINDDLETAAAELKQLLTALGMRTSVIDDDIYSFREMRGE